LFVAEYYELAKMTEQYDIERAICGVDCDYYKTNFTERYKSKFLRILTNIKDLERRQFVYFEDGDYVKSEKSLFE